MPRSVAGLRRLEEPCGPLSPSSRRTGARLPLRCTVAVRRAAELLIEDGTYERASMHAKCIVVDGLEVLVTSANFTEAAQGRNVEVGLRLRRDEAIARRLVEQFDRLVELERLVRLA